MNPESTPDAREPGECLTYTEIARRLGCTRQWVMILEARALRKLRVLADREWREGTR